MGRSKGIVIIASFLFILSLASLTYCYFIIRPANTFIPPLTVIGDVKKTVSVQSLYEIGAAGKTTMGGVDYQTVKLTDLLAKAQPAGIIEKVLLVAGDGFTSVITAENLKQCNLAFTPADGWRAVNPNLPISSNAKLLSEVIVVAKPGFGQNSFTVINGDQVLNETVGGLYAGTLISYPYYEGAADVEHDNKTYSADIYTRRRVFSLSNLVTLAAGEKIFLLGADGDYLLTDCSGYYELCGNCLNYIQPETRQKMEKVKAAVITNSVANITDTYYDALHYLENGEQVLVILIDGLNYRDFQTAIEKGYLPFLQGKPRATKMMGFYPLKDNVWLSSMLSGFSPKESGVVGVADNDLTVDTLFTAAEAKGKKALMLSSSNLLDLHSQVTVTDDNHNGNTNDEIYTDLLQSINDDYELIVTRFDAFGENSGDTWKNVSIGKDKLVQLDTYLKEVTRRWSGKIIITALPGSSFDNDTADFSESLFVPYLLLSDKN